MSLPAPESSGLKSVVTVRVGKTTSNSHTMLAKKTMSRREDKRWTITDSDFSSSHFSHPCSIIQLQADYFWHCHLGVFKLDLWGEDD